jgi:V/A-type H+-transporting ATPase subunit I
MPREAYQSISLYTSDLDDFFFIPASIEQKEVWGIYLTTRAKSVRIDSLFKMLHFERVRISDRARGTPEASLHELMDEIGSVNTKIDALKADLGAMRDKAASLIDKYYDKVLILTNMFELRKKIVRTKTSFHIITWLPATYVDKLVDEFAQVSIVAAPINVDLPGVIKPPTLIKNFPLFRPFEQFVEMYGLPSYTEIDPTPFIAFTYMLFFGIMFADVGQGLIISLTGLAMWFKKKINLGRILGVVGISSMLFGLIFGSVFGIEDIVHGYNPLEHINQVLFAAVGLGSVTVSCAIILNIINGARQKDYARVLFSHNGVAGLAFYWSVLMVVLTAVNFLPADGLMPIFITVAAICLLVMYLKEPLGNLINKKEKLIQHNPVEFFVVSFFEMFEVILSFMTNTISFIRVGAFALNHVGMMTVVILLSQTADGGTNPAVFIIGNIVVIGLEGLIVGIQCLRLEYYEILGRFFEGNGRRFEPSALDIKKYKK